MTEEEFERLPQEEKDALVIKAAHIMEERLASMGFDVDGVEFGPDEVRFSFTTSGLATDEGQS